MRILAVDDSEDGRDLTEAMLVAGGYETVTTLCSAAEAYRYLAIGGEPTQKVSDVDLIILDILMPGIDGIEACASIRNDTRYADVPIIMVTSLADSESLANAFVAGANDYITKPLKRVELMARVRSSLKLKSELDRRKAREQELLQRVSTRGGSQISHCVDDNTGLFHGEVAEAYLVSISKSSSELETSVVAVAIDRLDAYRSTQGEARTAKIMAQVGCVVRTIVATVGVVAAIYQSGTIVLVAPGLQRELALELGEEIRARIFELGIANPEAINSNAITASVTVVTGSAELLINPVNILSRALSAISRAAAVGGNRVECENA